MENQFKNFFTYYQNAKEIIESTEKFFEKTLTTKVEILEKSDDLVLYQQGIIYIRAKSIFTEYDMLKALYFGYLLVESNKEFIDDLTEEDFDDLVPYLADKIHGLKTVKAEIPEKLHIEYDEEKGRLYISTSLVDFENPKLFITVSNGMITFSNGTHDNLNMWKADIDNYETMFATSVMMNYDTNKSMFFAKVPKKVVQAVDLKDLDYKRIK